METISMRDFANKVKEIARNRYNTDYYEVTYIWNSQTGDQFVAYIARLGARIERNTPEEVIDALNGMETMKNVELDIHNTQEDTTNDLGTEDDLPF